MNVNIFFFKNMLNNIKFMDAKIKRNFSVRKVANHKSILREA